MTGARVLEAAGSVPHIPTRLFTESDLVALWEGQLFPKTALKCRDGRSFRVIYRGRRTGGPGPDFHDAVIATPDELLRGDVELHVRSSDFRRHGHQRDPAYDSVVLHLVFRHDEDSDTELACGRRVPVVALSDWVAGRAEEIERWLEQPGFWREPCYSALERLGSEDAGGALDRLGDMRFRARGASMRRVLREAGPATGAADEAAWLGILEALGYGGQREVMAAVGRAVQWANLAESLAGLDAVERRRRALSALLCALDRERMKVPLVLRPMRPGNRPEARLKAAAVIAARFSRPGVVAALGPLVEEAAKGKPAPLVRALLVPGVAGKARAIEILTNAILPVFWADGLESLAEAAYKALPLPARYGAVKHIHSALSGEVPLSARRQQGMLYLLKQYCTQGGCGKCALS